MNSRSLLISAAALALAMFLVSMWIAPNSYLQRSATTFGVGTDGYKAAYEMLDELGFKVSRSFERPAGLAAHGTLWMMSPPFLDPEQKKYKYSTGEVTNWIRAGGIAIVFGGAHTKWKRLGLALATKEGGPQSIVSGELARAPRDIPVAKLRRFKAAPKGAEVMLAADGAPFAVEKPFGKGRLIAVADDRFVRNENLDEGDCSVLLADMALKLGAPVFDEWSHGISPPASLVEAIAGSRAIFPILIGFVAALAWALKERSWPRRTLADNADAPAPTIATFIESLGALYSNTGDPAAVFRAYRSGFLRRMRRKVSPRAEISEATIVERLARDSALEPATRRWLVEGGSPRDINELVIAVRAIESYPRAGA